MGIWYVFEKLLRQKLRKNVKKGRFLAKILYIRNVKLKYTKTYERTERNEDRAEPQGGFCRREYGEEQVHVFC